jgi:hypothetical protein
MKLGRFLVDTHVHSQRTAAGPELRKATGGASKRLKYSDLGKLLRQLTPYDNSARLLYDMETYRTCASFGLP